MKVDINVIDTNQSKLVSQMSYIFPQQSIEGKESQQQKKIESKNNSRYNSRYNSTISLNTIPTKSISSHTHPFKEDIAMLTVLYYTTSLQ